MDWRQSLSLGSRLTRRGGFAFCCGWKRCHIVAERLRVGRNKAHTADYSESKDKATFEIYGISGTETVSGEDFNVADIAKDDFVLVTYADNEIQTISDVEIMSNVEISKFSANGSNVTAVTVDGTKYDSSATLTYDTGVLSNYTANNLKDAT